MKTETVLNPNPSDVIPSTSLPTAPCSVVWCAGHPFVLEVGHGPARWVGVNDRGRPLALTPAELERRGWTRTER